MRVTKVFNEFFSGEQGGVLLIACTLISLLLANSSISESYIALWHFELGSLSIEHWINEALMAFFFLLIGLELKREVLIGELSSLKSAMLPIFAATGGMLIPAVIYLGFNFGTDTQHGFGIPMATDIAFAIGVLSLLGKRVPPSLKVFLTAVAVIDDLGAIIIIALFYTSDLSLLNLLLVSVLFAALMLFNKFKVRSFWIYLTGGIVMWYFMVHSGVHATLAGILLAIALPFEKGKPVSLSYKVEKQLHKPVALIVLPLFALANTAVVFNNSWDKGLMENESLGIITGLFVGKPLGVLLFSFIATVIGAATLPDRLRWKHVLGAGLIAGIGFTMSIFITLLAFDSSHLITESKISILFASLLSGLVGYSYLRYILKSRVRPSDKSGLK